MISRLAILAHCREWKYGEMRGNTGTEIRGQERVKKVAFGEGASRSGELARRIRDSLVALVLLAHRPIAPPVSPRNGFGVQRASQGQTAR